MNDAQREMSGPGLTPKSEDLDVVLGRFKDWAETRRARPSVNPGLGTGLGRPLGEAREVTYEEALRASSYRRSADLAAMDPLLPDFHGENAAGVKAEENLPCLAETQWREAFVPRPPAVEQSHRPESCFVKTVQAIMTEPSDLKAAPDFLDVPRSMAKMEVEDQPLKDPLPARAKIGIVERSSAASLPLDTQATEAAAQPEVVRKPRPPAAPRKQPLVQPAFRDVLKGTAALVAAAQPGTAPLERGKSTSLTLRVSDGEQARIQVCAARANLSVSAYLRQCALGVDDLRNQVELALSTLHRQQAGAAAPPGLSAIPGILGRCAVQCLRRLRRNSADYTVISLR